MEEIRCEYSVNFVVKDLKNIDWKLETKSLYYDVD